VRTLSRRLPSKCLLPFGNYNVLEHIIHRARMFNIEPILCTTTDVSDDVIEQIAINEKIRYFRGSISNKLKRWSDCASKFGINAFHSIDADDLFFDGDEIAASMQLLLDKKVDVVYPSAVSSGGSGSVGFSLKVDFVKRVVAKLEAETNTEMIWHYLEKEVEIRKLLLPDNPNSPCKLRLTLDFEEDYWLLESVRRIVGNFASRQIVDQLFISNPNLYMVNWFRNSEWKAAQKERD